MGFYGICVCKLPDKKSFARRRGFSPRRRRKARLITNLSVLLSKKVNVSAKNLLFATCAKADKCAYMAVICTFAGLNAEFSFEKANADKRETCGKRKDIRTAFFGRLYKRSAPSGGQDRPPDGKLPSNRFAIYSIN